jgi:hypothetical protein
MKKVIVGIAAAGLMLASSGWAQTQKSSAKKKTTEAKAAATSASTAKAEAKKEAPAAAKPAPAAPAEHPADPRVTQVYTPKLPPLPEGAVQVDKNTWRATEKDGKVWIYRRTPFGFSKYEADEKPAEEALTDLVAVDKGDSVEFQRKTPFGLSKWTKKKSELDENETAALKRATPSSSKGAQE